MLLGILRVSSPRLRRPQVETRPPEPLRDSGRLDAATDQNRATRRQPLPPCWSPVRATPAPPSPARLSAPGSIAPCDIIVLLFATQIKHKSGTPIHDGPLKAEVTFCVQGVISPLLANLFLHYAFDAWMSRTYPHIPFERYADDAICHCKSADEARALWSALQDRFAACKLVLHPEKTKIVYCKDANRRGDFPNQSFDFLGLRRHWPPDAMPRRCREFMDSRLRRCPPDRASAVPHGQAGGNAMRFPHLAHRSAAAHKLHSTPQQDSRNLIPGEGKTST